MNDHLALLIGVLCAGVGGELFVRGTVGLAHAWRISPAIVAVSVAAFATSSPELTVSINSALAGTPQIALGDALGSNVVNVTVILAVALLIVPITAPTDTIRRDFTIALAAPGLGAVLLYDGVLSRVDGLLLLTVFACWAVAVLREARRQRRVADQELGDHKPIPAILLGVAGLGLLILAGRLIVSGATGIASARGIDAFLIGATVVALGTSVPELATAVISGLRQHEGVGLGTILGSNIFNGLLIVGLTASMSPISVRPQAVAPALILGLASVALTYPPWPGVLGRWRGLLLLATYAVYIVAIVRWG